MIGKLINLLLIAGLACAGYFFSAPYRAVSGLTAALENENAAALDRYVDFPALRSSFADDFALKMGIDAQDDSLGGILATRIAGAFIDSIVSPETMVSVLKDKERRDRVGLSASYGEIFSRGAWHGLDRFILSDSTGAPVTLLAREGTSWKVVAMRLK